MAFGRSLAFCLCAESRVPVSPTAHHPGAAEKNTGGQSKNDGGGYGRHTQGHQPLVSFLSACVQKARPSSSVLRRVPKVRVINRSTEVDVS